MPQEPLNKVTQLHGRTAFQKVEQGTCRALTAKINKHFRSNSSISSVPDEYLAPWTCWCIVDATIKMRLSASDAVGLNRKAPIREMIEKCTRVRHFPPESRYMGLHEGLMIKVSTRESLHESRYKGVSIYESLYMTLQESLYKKVFTWKSPREKLHVDSPSFLIKTCVPSSQPTIS